MSDLFNIVASICIVQMAFILALVEQDRACKNEPLHIIWSRRIGFGAGSGTLLLAGVSRGWEGSCLLMATSCMVILSINIVSIKARNHPPLQGHRFLRKAGVANFWRRYP
jgi:hypothetical protein